MRYRSHQRDMLGCSSTANANNRPLQLCLRPSLVWNWLMLKCRRSHLLILWADSSSGSASRWLGSKDLRRRQREPWRRRVRRRCRLKQYDVRACMGLEWWNHLRRRDSRRGGRGRRGRRSCQLHLLLCSCHNGNACSLHGLRYLTNLHKTT